MTKRGLNKDKEVRGRRNVAALSGLQISGLPKQGNGQEFMTGHFLTNIKNIGIKETYLLFCILDLRTYLFRDALGIVGDFDRI
jgi:hypothetical protein